MENLVEEKLRVLLKNRYILVLFILLFLILDSLVFVLPYYLEGYAIPVGWDTPWYISNMRLIEEQGVFPFFVKTHGINFFSILEYLIASAFNISFITAAMGVPIAIALLFPLVNFQIAKKLAKSNGLSLLAMLFTIVDYNVVRMAGIFHRNLFCLLLIQIAVFLVLPNLLEQRSNRDFLIFVSLMVIAGISQMETFAMAMTVLSLLLFFYLKQRLVKCAKFLLLYILVPIFLVVLLEAPFLPILIEGHMIVNPMYMASHPHRTDLTAHPWNYALSLGMGLIPLFVVGTYVCFKNVMKHQKPLFQLLLFWNLTVIAGSFLPVFNVRVPGWRFLLLVIFPAVALSGFVKLFLWMSSLPRKRALSVLLLKALLLATLFAISLTGIISNQKSVYRPWISDEIYRKLVWISDYAPNSADMVVLYVDSGASTFDYAQFYRNWVWAVISTRANVYFGNVDSLLQSEPTSFEDPYLNLTSHIFWDNLENFTLEGTNIYLIEEWYEFPLDNANLKEVKPGIYYIQASELANGNFG